MSETEHTDAGPRHEAPIGPEEIVAEETTLGKLILDRPAVKDCSMHYGDGRVIVLVTFEGLAMPEAFANDYGLALRTAYAYDDRPRWKRLLDIGPPVRLVGEFVRDREMLEFDTGDS